MFPRISPLEYVALWTFTYAPKPRIALTTALMVLVPTRYVLSAVPEIVPEVAAGHAGAVPPQRFRAGLATFCVGPPRWMWAADGFAASPLYVTLYVIVVPENVNVADPVAFVATAVGFSCAPFKAAENALSESGSVTSSEHAAIAVNTAAIATAPIRYACMTLPSLSGFSWPFFATPNDGQ